MAVGEVLRMTDEELASIEANVQRMKKLTETLEVDVLGRARVILDAMMEEKAAAEKRRAERLANAAKSPPASPPSSP